MASDIYFDSIKYTILGLILGGIVQWFTSTYAPNLPYTVLIFFLAVGIAILLVARQDDIPPGPFVLDSVLQSDIIVFVLLPILIFGETMNLNVHHVLAGLAQSTWLAGPGVVVGTLLMGAFAKGIFPSWSLNYCFLFGAILSATDPVAVVSLLKTSGASHHLTLLIVGESLLNDGTAMVMFTLFLHILQGNQATAGGVITFFLKVAIGSCALGVGIGLATNRLMRYFDHPVKKTDMALQVFITITSAYFSFILAQYTLEISGVLCSSAAGLILAWLAPPFILHHHKMHEVWSYLEWICNTLVFFFAGLAAGTRTYKYIEPSDFYWLIILFVVLFVIRAIILVIFFPILSRGGLICTVNDAIFMVWGGLRGALGIALALLVDHEDIVSTDQSSKLFIFISGIAALTLLINATTSPSVLRYLKLVGTDEESHEKMLVLDHIRRKLKDRMKATIDTELHHEMGQYDRMELLRFCRLLRDDEEDVSDKMDEDSVRFSHIAGERLSNFRAESTTRKGIQPDLMSYIRTKFLTTMRNRYKESIEGGKIGRASYAANALMNSIDVAMDYIDSPNFGLHDWDPLEKKMEIPDFFLTLGKFIEETLDYIGIKVVICEWMLARRGRRVIYILTSFIDAHEYAQRKIHTFLGGEEDADQEVFVIPEEMQIRWESEMEVSIARNYLKVFDNETLKMFYSIRAARTVLHKQSELIEKMVEEGSLSDTDAAHFFEVLEADDIKVTAEREKLNKKIVRSRVEQARRERDVEKESMKQEFEQKLKNTNSVTLKASDIANNEDNGNDVLNPAHTMRNSTKVSGNVFISHCDF